MNTVPFPTQQPQSQLHSSSSTEYQAQKKDIAAYLSNHIQPNHNTTVTLSDTSGKTVTIRCNTDDPSQLLHVAISYLTP